MAIRIQKLTESQVRDLTRAIRSRGKSARKLQLNVPFQVQGGSGAEYGTQQARAQRRKGLRPGVPVKAGPAADKA
jgi:hypothetical protein